MNKKILPASLLLFFSVITQAQVIESKKGNEDRVFEKVAVEAYTNSKTWADHLEKKTRLADSISAKIPSGTYKVSVQFVIDEYGNIGQVQALNDPGYGLARIAVNAVSTYAGEWKPASQCGRNVKAYRKQSISFVISQ